MKITVPDDCNKLQDYALAALVRFKLAEAKKAQESKLAVTDRKKSAES